MKKAPLFKKPKTPAAFTLAKKKPKTEASIWRGSSKDVAEATERVLARRHRHPLP
jgi:hypothetical protein